MKTIIFVLIIIIILIGIYFLFIMLFGKSLNIQYQVNGKKTKYLKTLFLDEQEDIHFLYSPILHKNGSNEFRITFPRKNRWSLLSIDITLCTALKTLELHKISLKKDYFSSSEEIVLSDWSQLENNLFLHKPYARIVIISKEEIPNEFSIYLNVKLKNHHKNELKQIQKTIYINKTWKWRYHGFFG